MATFLRFAALLLLYAILPAVCGAQITWTRHPSNPVIHSASSNPNCLLSLRASLGPSVLWDSGRGVYMAWFQSLSIFSPVYAFSHGISFNGADWYYLSRSPVLETGMSGFDVSEINGPCVIRDGAEYRMYYSGSSGGSFSIGMATSSDGVHWTRHPGNPVLIAGASGAWDDAGVLYCKVLKVGPTYFMWYSGRDGETSRIGLATSPDGAIWTKHAANPVVDVSEPGKWDAYYVEAPGIVYTGSQFIMLYTARPSLDQQKIGLATSSDGIVWNKYSANPVLSPQAGWEGTTVTVSSLLYADSTFHLWFSGSGGLWQAGYATSGLVTAVGEDPQSGIPTEPYLKQNYPNPFNPATHIEFGLTQRGYVRIDIWTIMGQKVETLLQRDLEAGTHSVVFDGSRLASGTYIYRLTIAGAGVESNVLQGKMLLLK